MQYTPRTQNSGIEGGAMNQSSTLRTPRYGKRRRGLLKIIQLAGSTNSLCLVSSRELFLLYFTASLYHLFGRPDIPPLETLVGQRLAILLLHISKLRQQSTWNQQAPPGAKRCWWSHGTITTLPSGHPEPLATTLALPTQSECSPMAAGLLNL